MDIKEVSMKAVQDFCLNNAFPPPPLHLSATQNAARVVSAYRLWGGSFVSVGLNERGRRHFLLLTSCLLDGSLLGSSGQTAHSLNEGLFLGSDTGCPLIHGNKLDWRNWGLCGYGIEWYSVNMWEQVELKDLNRPGHRDLSAGFWHADICWAKNRNLNIWLANRYYWPSLHCSWRAPPVL